VALVQIVLVGGIVQVLASVALSLAKVGELQSAIAEGPLYYVLGTLLAGLATATVWLFRRRAMIALPLLLGWPLIVYLVLGSRLTVLGLAYHGEFILYHFLSLLCVALCIAVPLRWARRPELGPLRKVPFLLATLGSIALGVAHLAAIPSLRVPSSPGLAIGGAACLLAAWPVSLVAFWRNAGPWRMRLGAALLVLPVTVRVALTGADGFIGAPVPASRVIVLGVTIGLVATGVAFAFRPRIETWVRMMIAGLCLASTLFFWLLYDRGFGELEDGFEGLIRSFLGFHLPYPAYVSEWKVMGMMMAIFFIFSTVYTALVSSQDRHRGIPLALMAMAGIGLTSPHLGLMLGAAALTLIDTLVSPEPEVESPRESTKEPVPTHDIEAILDDAAARLGFEAPVSLSPGERSATVVLHGHVGRTEVDVRARLKRRWEIEVAAGLAGRGTATVELVPDGGTRGTRPPHPIARTHKLVGDARALEDGGERLMDALSPFPDAHVSLWPGGCGVELGRDVSRLDADTLDALVRAAASVC
jgi:hypothetical protein